VTALGPRTLTVLENAFRRLEAQVPPPRPKPIKDGFVLRYHERTIEQALVQKLARYISSLSAAQVLLDHGFVQEQAVLQRTLDEIGDDIFFLAIAITNDEVTELHERYLDAFWAEEFEEPDDPIGTLAARAMVQRSKIRAYISRIVGSKENPSRDLAVLKTISKVYSGYVHAASPHIMDLCGGDPPVFHLNGMLGTPRIEDHEYDIWNYYYRGIVNACVVGKAFGDASLVDALLQCGLRFEEMAGRDFGARRPSA
jgi:hypothetical protein